jgi:hypothetical protein
MNRAANPPNVAALETKLSSAATKRSTPTAPMGMSSSATPRQAILATTASGRRASNVESSRAKRLCREHAIQTGLSAILEEVTDGLRKYLKCTYNLKF